MVVDRTHGRRRATGTLADGAGRIKITTGDAPVTLRKKN